MFLCLRLTKCNGNSERNRGGNVEKMRGSEKEGLQELIKKRQLNVVAADNENLHNDDSKKAIKEHEEDLEGAHGEREECLEATQAVPEGMERTESVLEQAVTQRDEVMERTAAARDEGRNKSVKSKKKIVNKSRKARSTGREAAAKPSDDELYIDDPYMYNEKLRGGNSLLALDLNAKNQMAAMQDKTQCSVIVDKNEKKKDGTSERRKKKSGSLENTKTQCSTIMEKERTKEDISRKKKHDTDRKVGASTKKSKGREDAGASDRISSKYLDIVDTERNYKNNEKSITQNGSSSPSHNEQQSTTDEEFFNESISDDDLEEEGENSIVTEEEGESLSSSSVSLKLNSINESDTSESSLSRKLRIISQKKRVSAGFNVLNKKEKVPKKKGSKKDTVPKKDTKKSTDMDSMDALKEMKALNEKEKQGSTYESVLLQRSGPTNSVYVENKIPDHQQKRTGVERARKNKDNMKSIIIVNVKNEHYRGTAGRKASDKATEMVTARAGDTEIIRNKEKGNIKGNIKKPEKHGGINNLLNVAQWIYGGKPSGNTTKLNKNPKKSK
ncbi:hypothetical protein DICVIV_01513 [Dictyocaulus viviparus]|uniref:Uncharacterized protein n=1 Tax=Dictyocaulus viviparus TaxID=29172 RepID=A0A0D8YCL2_DICVI|nr:hypothetical protein DICVIV_01513 [Dictyocaulus viviparus]